MTETTAQALITSSMRLIGVLASGEAPKADELTDAFDVLNAMIDEWGVHRLTMQANATYTFPLVVGQQSYTISDGGDFELPPPLEIDQLGLIYPDTGSGQPTEVPLSLVTQAMYAATQIKALQSSYPTVAYYDRATPEVGTIWFWPVPTATDLNVAIYAPQYFSQFSNLNQPVTLSEGYLKALRYNLAVELLPEYSVPATAQTERIERIAFGAKRSIKAVNMLQTDLTVDAALQPTNPGTYNILTDSGGQ